MHHVLLKHTLFMILVAVLIDALVAIDAHFGVFLLCVMLVFVAVERAYNRAVLEERD